MREASFEDYEQIAALEQRNGLDTKPYGEWRHLWAENPVYRNLQTRWPIGWVLETPRGEIVGSLANLPLACELSGRRLLAACSRAWVVDAPYRAYALVLLERILNQPDVELFFSASVSPNASPAVSTMGCERVPVGLWDHSAFWMIGYQACLEAALANRPIPLRSATVPLLALGLRLKDLLTGARLPSFGHEYDISAANCFEDYFDSFWEELRSRYREKLLLVRTREVLAWHFQYALQRRTAWIVTAAHSGRIAAYAIFDTQDNGRGLRRMRIVDVQSLDGPKPALALVSWAVEKCRRDGIHALEDIGCWFHYTFGLGHLAPYRRRLSCWTYFYKARDANLREYLRSAEAWNPSNFDADSSL